MDVIKRKVLNRHSDLIIKDLHGDVIEILRDKGILTTAEFEYINSQGKQEERNQKFLSILYTKHDGFTPFLEALKDWYSWIEKRLRETLTGRPSTLEEAIALSKVPAIPLINVSRVDLLTQVREKLRKLKKGEYVVLHGMSGCGKSSLAAEALHDEILLTCFQGRVVWLSCGQDVRDDENEVLALQIELNAAICDEELVNDVKAAKINTLRLNLQRRFQVSDFKDGLVVLDDVHSPHVIEALKIGCKTLITTNDKDVMKKQGGRCTYIEVSESFKEEETMQYLAQCVNVSVNKLPSQAREIHRYGKGHPLIMSLIGAHLRDHVDESQQQDNNWQEWLNVLLKKDYGELRRSFTNEPLLPKTIEKCINNLEPELREKYQDFALFVEDVNVKTEVLEILWDLPKWKVRTIMNEFYTKSLVVRKYNKSQSSYVYGIHDLLLYFLRQKLDKEELKNLHLKLINRYKEVCKEDFSQLPRNDNYFFYYIGYHIANSGQYAMFPELYFNLEFIEAKLKVAGPGDLLLDYKRYGPHFIENSLFETSASAVAKRLSDFVRFVEAAGLEVRRDRGPDVVQLALQEPHDSDVYAAALRLARARPDRTYLRFQLGPSKSKAAPHTVQTREKVSAACFSNSDSDLLIVAFESGNIQIVNQRGHKIREYEGHDGSVTGLNVSTQKSIFLSVCRKAVKLWHLPDLDFNAMQGGGDRSPSPSQRQDNHAELFPFKSPDRRKSWFAVEYPQEISTAVFSHDGSKFAVCCMNENKVEVYGITKKELQVIGGKPWTLAVRLKYIKPTTCAFSADGKYMAVGSASSQLILHHFVSEQTENPMIFRRVLSYPVLSVFSLSGIKFGVLTQASLSVWDLKNIDQTDVPCQKSVPCLKDYAKGESELYVSCAAAADGSVVAVATSNNKVLICDPSDGSVIREVHESTGNIKYVAMDETKERRLLACYDDSTVRVWRLGAVHTERPATMRSNFVVAWAENGQPILVAPTLKSCVKKITDLKDSQDLPVPVNGDINICGISDCGQYIVVGTPSGQVFLYREGMTAGSMINILSVSGNDSILKLSVKKLWKRIFVVVGLKRSLKVWTSREEPDEDVDDVEGFVYKKRKIFEFALIDQLVDSFILPSEKLISVSKMGNIKRWCLRRGRELETLWHGRLDNVWLCAADLGPDLTLVTLDCAQRKLHLYNLAAATVEQESFALEGTPVCCSFSSDGKKLAVGTTDGSIQLWDMESLHHRTFKAGEERIECVCVSGTGVIGAATPSKLLLVTAAGSVGQARLTVSKVVMLPDDCTVLTVDKDGHLHLVDQFSSSNCGSVLKLSRTFSAL